VFEGGAKEGAQQEGAAEEIASGKNQKDNGSIVSKKISKIKH